jgi:hypothetical protein
MSDFKGIWDAALSGDVATIQRVIDSHPGHVSWNAKRNSVQVKSCGTYVANIPVRRSLALSS